jgi:hypothetical protein
MESRIGRDEHGHPFVDVHWCVFDFFARFAFTCCAVWQSDIGFLGSLASSASTT